MNEAKIVKLAFCKLPRADEFVTWDRTESILLLSCDPAEPYSNLYPSLFAGMYTPALKERMKVLENRKVEIEGLLAGADAPPVIRVHPNMAEVYRLKVAELEIALNDDSIKAEAGDILRSLIDRVVLTPLADAPDGIDAQLHGDLVAILALSNDDGHKQKLPAKGMAGSLLSVVAGARNHLDLLLSTGTQSVPF